MDLKGRHFLKLMDYTPEEITYLLDLAADLKDKKKKGIPVNCFQGKNVALIFEKTSTRTRCSFEVAAHDLGLGTTYLDPSGSQIGKNGLTNEFHPTQMLADLLTIREHLGRIKGVKLVYMGDARYNMGNSYMVACAKMGMHFTACAPKAYFPSQELVNQCKVIASENGGSITLTEDVMAGTRDADVICTDVWVSMGEPDYVWEERINLLSPYQVNKAIMDNAGNAIFMHCLPAFHDLNTRIGKEIGEKFGISEMEVTNEVFESPASVVFDEAENRMHTIKAVMAASLGYEF